MKFNKGFYFVVHFVEMFPRWVWLTTFLDWTMINMKHWIESHVATLATEPMGQSQFAWQPVKFDKIHFQLSFQFLYRATAVTNHRFTVESVLPNRGNFIWFLAKLSRTSSRTRNQHLLMEICVAKYGIYVVCFFSDCSN